MYTDDDIRSHHDLIQGEFEVRRILQTTFPPPTSTEETGFDTSGLDCLVTIIRHLYGYILVGPYARENNEQFAPAEACNPILRYAWKLFNHENESGTASSDAKKRWADDKLQLALNICAINGLAELDQHALSFENLVNSDLMMKTFWCHPIFNMFRKERMIQLPDGNLVSRPFTNMEMATRSLLKLDRFRDPTMTLQDLFHQSLGEVATPDGLEQLHPNMPPFVRIVFSPPANFDNDYEHEAPGVAQLQALGFYELQGFDMAESLVEDNDESSKYHLVATVCMRADTEEHDYIRTYMVNGFPIRPSLEGLNFVNYIWRVGKPGNRYMLFYARCPDISLTWNLEVLPKQRPDSPRRLQRRRDEEEMLAEDDEKFRKSQQ
ncbi:hypothetical protein G7046_g4573 [Stylonectria norvegica]|nr:hypothetical protein G7046_g4573 [Stylonectria norvegica]